MNADPNTIGTIDVGPALRRLAEKYPNEEVSVHVDFNDSVWGTAENRRGLRFWIFIGDPSGPVKRVSGGGGDTLDAAVADAIANADKRLPELRQQIADAQKELDDAQAKLLALQSAEPQVASVE